jgi:hypothetical protein
MTITGLSGDIGSGKSWKMLEYALEQTEFKRKYLVTNFALNLPGLKRYCAAKKQWWNVHMIDSGWFAVVSLFIADKDKENLSLTPLFKGRENSVVCLDEAGIFLNSRNFKNTPAQLLMDLAQSRKSGNDLIWAAQFDTQVDIQFRNLTQFWVHCDGWTAYDKKMRRPALKWKTYFYFKGAEYQRWQSSTKARTSFIRTYFTYAFKTDYGPLSPIDIMLFSAFDSFTRLENQAAAAKEMTLKSYKPNDLQSSDYYQKLATNRLRMLVKRGVMRRKTPVEKLVKKVVSRPRLTEIEEIESTYLSSQENENYHRETLQLLAFKPSIYILPEQPKSVKKPLPFLSLAVSLSLSLALFYSVYSLIDARFAPPRRAPLAGVAGQTAQNK